MRSLVTLVLTIYSMNLKALPQATAKPWARISDPIIMHTSFVRALDQLPVTGRVSDEKKYWSGDYWALKRGSINYRWNALVPHGFNLRSPTKEEAARMNQEELSRLAPSEKFDLFLGNYHYPLKKEVERFTSPERQEWEGICHGWAPALMHHNEPHPKVLLNPDGLEIPFGSADIKALISYYYAYKHKAVKSRQMGSRCGLEWWQWGNDRCKDDMNAGAFHIVLSNKIGLKGESFVADIENGAEVWNHVPIQYVMTVTQDNLPPETDSAKGTYRTIWVKAQVWFIYNSENNSWGPILGTSEQMIRKKTYDYTLDLDSQNNILGGNWKSKSRPDFLWLVDKVGEFKGKWVQLTELLND